MTGFEVRLLLLTAAGAALSLSLLATGWWLWTYDKD